VPGGQQALPDVISEINRYLRGWSNTSRPATIQTFGKLRHHAENRVRRLVQKRSKHKGTVHTVPGYMALWGGGAPLLTSRSSASASACDREKVIESVFGEPMHG